MEILEQFRIMPNFLKDHVTYMTHLVYHTFKPFNISYFSLSSLIVSYLLTIWSLNLDNVLKLPKLVQIIDSLPLVEGGSLVEI